MGARVIEPFDSAKYPARIRATPRPSRALFTGPQLNPRSGSAGLRWLRARTTCLLGLILGTSILTVGRKQTGRQPLGLSVRAGVSANEWPAMGLAHVPIPA